MNYFFIDTNIWLDWLIDRQDGEDAKLLVIASEKGKCSLLTSAITVSTISYVLRKEKNLRFTLMRLLRVTEIIDTKKTALLHSLSSEFKDIEDAYQYYTAISDSKIDAIVTNNTRDFKHSKLPVLKAKQALQLL